MPSFSTEKSNNQLQDIIDTGGRAKSTLDREGKVIEIFLNFAKDHHDQDGEKVFENPVAKLEDIILDFFVTLRVGKKEDLPKRNTVEVYKSFIKGIVKKKTGWDLTEATDFPRFAAFYKGFLKKLKSEGKGDTCHNDEIPKETLEKIFVFLKDVQGILEADGDITDLIESNIPKEHRKTFHYLVEYGAFFLISLFTARRGREGLDSLKKEHFKICAEDGQKFFKKTVGELSKNHRYGLTNIFKMSKLVLIFFRSDDEDLTFGGIIPFEENDFGLNPGVYLEKYLERLHPECDFLFQRPKRPSKKFKLEDNPTVWYEPSKVGLNLVANFLPTLCEALGLKRCTNNQIRPTAIRYIKRGGFSDREIMTISGHKTAETLKHYDPKPSTERQMGMACAISNAGSKVLTPGGASSSKEVPEFVQYQSSEKRPFLKEDKDSALPKKRTKTGMDDDIKENYQMLPLTQGKNTNVSSPILLTLHREQELANDRSRREQDLAAQRQQLLYKVFQSIENNK